MTTKLTKSIEFCTAAIDITLDKVVIYLEPGFSYPKTQKGVIDGCIEYYEDGSISVYGYVFKYSEMFGGQSYWLRYQDEMKKYCKMDMEKVEREYGFFRTLWRMWRKKKPEFYLCSKKVWIKHKKMNDFKMTFLYGNNLIIMSGVNREANVK